MTQINLLPWREQARKQKQIKFALILVGVIALAILTVVNTHWYLNSLLKSQQSRIDFLQLTIDNESSVLMQLNKQKKEMTETKTAMNFLFGLRRESYQAIRLLNELPSTVPESIKLVTLTREGNKISILGKASSNLQITLFMENLSKSIYFNQPELANISGKENSSGEERFFQLKLEQKNP